LVDRVRAFAEMSFGPADATSLRDAVLTTLAGDLSKPRGRIDPRVRRAIGIMFEHRDQDLSVADLARRVGMSESHFSHSFSEQIGVRVSRYRMWLRAKEASRHLAAGATITEAAHEAGFSDAAHLSRTFKRLIGQTPTAAQQGLVQMYAIDDEL